MLDSGKEQTIIVNKGATDSLMFMQKLENTIFFVTFFYLWRSDSASFSHNCFHSIQFIPLADEYLEWLNQLEHLSMWCQTV